MLEILPAPTVINDYEVEITLAGLSNKEEIIFDSTGDLNIETKNYTFFTVNATESFDAAIINNEDTLLNLYITGIDDSYNPVILDFNGTNYTASLFSSNSTGKHYRSLRDNLSFSNLEDIYHQWYFNLSGVIESTIVENQTNVIVAVAPCNTTINYTILNISFYDEITSVALNASTAYDLAITDGTNNFNQAGSFTNVFSAEFFFLFVWKLIPVCISISMFFVSSHYSIYPLFVIHVIDDNRIQIALIISI